MLLSCAGAAAVGVSLLVAPYSAQASTEPQALALSVKVQINSDLVEFPDAQPFIDEKGLTQVPVRFVSEELGFKVDWSTVEGLFKVRLTSQDGRSLELETGDCTAVVNGEAKHMDSAPVLKNGRVFVPLRFISEAKGIRVQWDPSNFIAILNEDGNYHAPAWYAPRMELLSTFTASAYSAAPEENGGYAGLDYFGNPLELGTVAVDPSVIPLGTRLYIEGYNFDGLPEGGMVVEAKDIGGSMKGNRIDIFVPSTRDHLLKFGLQEVKVYKLPQNTD
jgi:3D (Asp-Asp-Asp) domain-containing protein